MIRTSGLAPLLILSALLGTSACRSTPETPPSGTAAPAREPLVPSRLLGGGGTTTASAAAPAGTFQGRVLETLTAGPYTYVQVDSGAERRWAAAPEADVAEGDLVRFSTAMPMAQYESKTLSRTFDVVYFVQSVDRVAGDGASPSEASSGLPAGHPSVQTQPAADDLDHGRARVEGDSGIELTGIEVPPGGMSIASLHERAATIAGDEVQVRGRVVKVTPGVMEHNWLHVQDGSAEGEAGDLTVITDGIAAVGDLVLVQGHVAVDQNFGFGYEYPVLVKDALVTVE